MTMTLTQVRQKFVELSGRYDLVSSTSTWADNGADFYIQAGQDFLDRRSNVWKKTGRIYDELAAGVWYKTFQRARVIEAVYINNTTGRSRLTKKDFHWLHTRYSSTIASTDQGTPLYFCPAQLRAIDDTDMDSLAAFFNYVMDDSDTYRGVIILPPPNEAIVIEIVGQFYAATLSALVTNNFWTDNHPELLILAALYQLEVLGHRNSQGAKDYLTQLDIGLSDIDKDLADEESYDGTDWREDE
jgi:hypothetical protein